VKKVFITGSSGFIGSALCRALENMDVELAGTKNSQLLPRNVKPIAYNLDKFESFVGDWQPDFFINLAGQYIKESENYDSTTFLEANVEVAFRAARRMSPGSTFINASSYLALDQFQMNSPTLQGAIKQSIFPLLDYFSSKGDFRLINYFVLDTYGMGDRRPKVLPLMKAHLLNQNSDFTLKNPNSIIYPLALNDFINILIADIFSPVGESNFSFVVGEGQGYELGPILEFCKFVTSTGNDVPPVKSLKIKSSIAEYSGYVPSKEWGYTSFQKGLIDYLKHPEN
jgi:nucleoside-diphosphate-sugar epimerase